MRRYWSALQSHQQRHVSIHRGGVVATPGREAVRTHDFNVSEKVFKLHQVSKWEWEETFPFSSEGCTNSTFKYALKRLYLEPPPNRHFRAFNNGTVDMRTENSCPMTPLTTSLRPLNRITFAIAPAPMFSSISSPPLLGTINWMR